MTSPHIAKLIARNRAQRQDRFLYEDREWMRSRYEAGLDFRELAAEAECSLRTIARWFKIHGLTPRPAGHRRPGHQRPRRAGRCECGRSKSYGTRTKRCMACRNEQLLGETNPNWRGLADIMVLLRQHIADYWRPGVYERDGYRCQRCGDDRGHNLHAHHLVSLSILVQRKRRAWSPELPTLQGRLAFVARLREDQDIMDLANGMTLCEDCHRAIHRGAGTYVHALPRRGAP